MHRYHRPLLATLLTLAILLAGCTDPERPTATADLSDRAASPAAAKAAVGAAEDPGAATWRPFLLSSASELRPAAPPAKGSAEHQADLDELRQTMSAGTTAQLRAAEQWNGGPATVPWTSVTLELIPQSKIPPPKAARTLALVHAAMYDATIATWDAKYAYDRAPPAAEGVEPRAARATSGTPSYPSEHAAVASAAATVMMELFPDQKTRLEGELAAAQRARLVTGLNWPSDVDAGAELGRAVAQKVLAHAAADGSSATVNWTPPTDACSWEPAPPHHPAPLLPHWGKVKTWILANPDQFRAAPPPDCNSEEVRAQMREVYTVGTTLNERQKEIALYWADGPGDVTAPGHWNVIALEHMADEELSTPQAARIFALLNVALHDTAVAVWDTKYTYATIRPLTYLREHVDPAFQTHLMTPPFPAYVSGHAGLAGAASEVLAQFLPEDAVQLRALASEASMSRLYSGSHIRLDNEVGLEMGAKVGGLAIERARSDGGWTGAPGASSPMQAPSALKPWGAGSPSTGHAAASPSHVQTASHGPASRLIELSGTIDARQVSREHTLTLDRSVTEISITFEYRPGSAADTATAELFDPQGKARSKVDLRDGSLLELAEGLGPGEWKVRVSGDSLLGPAGFVASYTGSAILSAE